MMNDVFPQRYQSGSLIMHSILGGYGCILVLSRLYARFIRGLPWRGMAWRGVRGVAVQPCCLRSLFSSFLTPWLKGKERLAI